MYVYLTGVDSCLLHAQRQTEKARGARLRPSLRLEDLQLSWQESYPAQLPDGRKTLGSFLQLVQSPLSHEARTTVIAEGCAGSIVVGLGLHPVNHALEVL